MSNFPSPSIGGLSIYLAQIKKFPMLDAEEEYMLAKNWRENGNLQSAHKLVTSHLRLVAKIAMGYKGYGLPLFDLISEGNLGLMQAVKKYDPDKGFRLATYAIWWIRASIQEYVLHSWSLVKIGTTAAQKKLFFNLRKLRNQLKKYEEGYLNNDQIRSISQDLGVTEDEVKQMEGRVFNQDFSLNTPLNDENQSEWIDQIEDKGMDIESRTEKSDELDKRKELFDVAVKTLESRELEILEARRLKEPAKTLEELSQKFSISRERVRQIENKAIKKLQEEIKIISKNKMLGNV
jgi:RNA polymerase sigma-32 factor